MSPKYPSSRAGSKEKVVFNVYSDGSSCILLQCNIHHPSQVNITLSRGSIWSHYIKNKIKCIDDIKITFHLL